MIQKLAKSILEISILLAFVTLPTHAFDRIEKPRDSEAVGLVNYNKSPNLDSAERFAVTSANEQVAQKVKNLLFPDGNPGSSGDSSGTEVTH